MSAKSWQSHPKSTMDSYGNQIEMNQLPTLETVNASAEQKKMCYQAKVLLQSPLSLDHLLELDAVKNQARIFLKGLPCDKHFTLTLKIEEEE